jgi:tRNA threonylcarbamoyladenosine biosynthesis protein TsaE
MSIFHTFSEQETIKLGEDLSGILKEKDVVVLTGQLGGGKTTFIKGLLQGLGYKRRVLSPSFTLMREYTGKKVTVCHVDLYRLNTKNDMFSIGIEDYFETPKTITLIEWGEKIEEMLPRYIKIAFFYEGQSRRKIIISTKGKKLDLSKIKVKSG